jgi:hypothetical protein
MTKIILALLGAAVMFTACEQKKTAADIPPPAAPALPEPEKLTAPPEPPKPEVAPEEPAPPATTEATPLAGPDVTPAPAGGKVSLSVDTLARPGTIVSGKVTFSDGKSAAWYLDQMGRLGVSPEEQGYRPPAGDVEDFQTQLDRELQKLGF